MRRSTACRRARRRSGAAARTSSSSHWRTARRAARVGAWAPAPPRLAQAAVPVLAAFDRARLRMLAGVPRPRGRLLDVGAGRGRFVAAARAAGYDATGLEPAPGRVAAATAEHHVALATRGIEEADVAPGSQDAVSLWHALEHVEAPGEATARVASWLRPGAGLLVGVPNLGSLQARIGGERWFHLDVPRHRTHFTVSGLLALLRRHGLTPVAVHHVLAEHNAFGMWQTLVNRVTQSPSYLYHLLKRNARVASADLAVTALALPLAPAEGPSAADHGAQVVGGRPDGAALRDVVDASLHDQDLGGRRAAFQASRDLVRALAEHPAVRKPGVAAEPARHPVLVLALVVELVGSPGAHARIRVPQRRARGDRIPQRRDADGPPRPLDGRRGGLAGRRGGRGLDG